jgi:hypothetical protein
MNDRENVDRASQFEELRFAKGQQLYIATAAVAGVLHCKMSEQFCSDLTYRSRYLSSPAAAAADQKAPVGKTDQHPASLPRKSSPPTAKHGWRP